ncbi:MAG: hypothetical protein MJ204_03990 [Bacteroidales bacterium]|nr:hypothetical protein [Bacteroidales bacterium]
MKKIFFSLVLCVLVNSVYSQSYNQERTALTNFLIRMYENAPFDGVRVVDDYEHKYLISVLALDKSKYTNESQMNRVAEVKARSQASRFFNGSQISSNLIIRMSENSNGTSDIETIETINENSIGYVSGLQQLTNFSGEQGEIVFIYYIEL